MTKAERQTGRYKAEIAAVVKRGRSFSVRLIVKIMETDDCMLARLDISS